MSETNHEHRHWIEAAELASRVGSARAPVVIDVRRLAAVEASGKVIAGARWREHTAVLTWADELRPGDDVVVYCVHGHSVSQSAAAMLRSQGFRARALRGGLDGYLQVGGVTSAWCAERCSRREPSRWVTRERSAIDHSADRSACAWLIRRFIDRNARILCVQAGQVLAVAEEFAAMAFDVEGAPFEHRDGKCGFDAFLEKFEISDPALDRVADIVRGADSAQPDRAPQCAGLQALGLGVASLHRDDLAAIEHSLPVYDALYAWARSDTHNRPATGSDTGHRAP